jgi:protein-S-isoprenylcysteine O-methyltransferase Ste14
MLQLVFALIAYALFLASNGWLIARCAGLQLAGPAITLPDVLTSTALNFALLTLFALHHSVMARTRAKQWLATWFPESLERSLYVATAGILLLLQLWCWQPLQQVLWQFESGILSTLLWFVFGIGVVVSAASTFAFDHAHLFGLRQAWSAWRHTGLIEPEFHTPWLYRQARHPMQLGILLFLWSAPTMTLGQLQLALGFTAYMLVGLHFEEKSLLRQFGANYEDYQRRVPMLIPNPFRPSKPRL